MKYIKWLTETFHVSNRLFNLGWRTSIDMSMLCALNITDVEILSKFDLLYDKL